LKNNKPYFKAKIKISIFPIIKLIKKIKQTQTNLFTPTENILHSSQNKQISFTLPEIISPQIQTPFNFLPSKINYSHPQASLEKLLQEPLLEIILLDTM
jgi:hypothetical protein